MSVGIDLMESTAEARHKSDWASVKALILIVGLAVVVRLGAMPFVGDEGDLKAFDAWIQTIQL